MATPPIPLTGVQKNKLIDILNAPSHSPNFAETGEINPHLRVFAVHLDGTQNDRTKVPTGSHQTLVASLASNLVKSKTLDSRYYTGVGTQSNYIWAKIDSLIGIGCVQKAEEAYSDLIKAAEEWRKEDPLVQVHVHVVGFSRGAATALHFMNMVDKRGIEPVRDGHFYKKPVIKSFLPGAVKTSAVLIDIVATGQEHALATTLPPTAISVLHIVAGSEERIAFPLVALGTPGKVESSDWALVRGVKAPSSNTSFCKDGSFLYKRLHQRAIDGARHSDVGDSYGEGFIGRSAEFLALEFQASLGLPVPAAVKPHFSDVQQAFGHDSRHPIGILIDDVAGALGAEDSREKVRRIVRASEPVAWNGDMIQTASLKLKNDKGVVEYKTIRMAIPLAPGQPIPTEKECNKRARLEYHPEFPGRPQRFSSRTGVFKIVMDEFQRRRLLYNDMPIDDFDDENSLFQRLQADDEVELHVDISFKKQMVPLKNYKQNIELYSTQNLDKKTYSPDPWPQKIRDTVTALNDYVSSPHTNGSEKLSHLGALRIMADCMDAVAKSIKDEFQDADNMRIYHLKSDQSGKKYGRSPLYIHVDDIAITCNSANGEIKVHGTQQEVPFAEESRRLTGPQYVLKSRVQEMSNALNLLRSLFKKAGFSVIPGLDVTYDLNPKNAEQLVSNMSSQVRDSVEADSSQLYESMLTAELLSKIDTVTIDGYPMQHEIVNRMRMH